MGLKDNIMGHLIRKIFGAGLLLSFFVFWPKAEIAYEIPKVWFVSRWIELLALSTFLGILTIKRERIDQKLVISVILLLAVAIIGSLFGTDFHKSITGNYYRGDGLITLFHFLTLFFIVILFSERSWIKDFITVVSFSSLVLSFISLTEWLGNMSGSWVTGMWDGGFGNLFGNPNFLAGFLIVTLPLVAYLGDQVNNMKFKYVRFGGLFLQIIGILLTGAWVGYFGILLFISGWTFVKFKKIRAMIIAGGLINFGVLVFMFWNYQKSLVTPTSINPESRQRIVMKAVLAMRNRPLLGYGWANFDKAFESVDYPIHMDRDVYVDKAHSSIVEVLTSTGILGLFIYLFIILKIILNLYGKKELIDKYLLGTFVLLIFHMQTNVISVSEELLFWVIAGFSAKDS
jgi:O-antigen ligase